MSTIEGAISFSPHDYMANSSRKNQHNQLQSNAPVVSGEFNPRRTNQIQPEDPKKGTPMNRRVFAFGAGAVALGAAIAGREVFSVDEDEMGSEIMQTRNSLLKWNKEIREDNTRFEELIPQIIDLSTSFFSNQHGLDKEQFTGKMHILSEDQYSRDVADCGGEYKPLQVAYTSLTGDAYYNKTILSEITNHPENDAEHISPAGFMFFVALHELHHQAAQHRIDDNLGTRIVNDVEEPALAVAGLTTVVRNSSQTLPDGNYCHILLEHEADEAVVQYSTDMMYAALMEGTIDGNTFETDYSEKVANFRESIVNKYFGRNANELIGLQLQSKPHEFFSAIGAKINPNAQQDECYQIGYDYFFNVINAKG